MLRLINWLLKENFVLKWCIHDYEYIECINLNPKYDPGFLYYKIDAIF